MTDPRCPKPGRYRHYKGGLYEVLGAARHHDTGAPMIIYRCCESGEMHLRSIWSFNQSLLVEGRSVPRFSPVEEQA